MARAFPGTTTVDYLTIPASAVWNFNTDVCLMAIVRKLATTNVGNEQIIVVGTGARGYGLAAHDNTGVLDLTHVGIANSNGTSTTALVNSEWTALCVFCSTGGNSTFKKYTYSSGVLATETNANTSTMNAPVSDAGRIGNWLTLANGTAWWGTIDRIVIGQGRPTDQEFVSWALTGRLPTSLVVKGYWIFWDASPIGDLSANRNNLTLTGTSLSPVSAPVGLFTHFASNNPSESAATTVTAIPPDAVLASTNLSVSIGDIDEDPDAPDANWATATSAVAATDLRVSFGSPIANPYSVQNVRLQVRKTTGSGTPTLTAELRQANTLRKTLFTGTGITSTSGQVLQGDWADSDLVTVLDGSDVELRLVSSPGLAQSPGALPAYNTSGTLLSNATLAGANDVAIPAHTAGDLLLLTVCLSNTNDDQGFTSINTAGWTQLGGAGNEYGPAASNAKLGVGWKLGNGSETVVNINTTGGITADRLLARVHRFTAANGFAATAVANVSAALSGTGTTLSMPTVNPGGAANRLAVTVYVSSGNTTAAPATGESGGDWTEPVAESAAVNGMVGLQVSSQSGGGSISGGTATLGTTGDWVAIGFTLEPALVSGAAENTVEIGAIEWNAQYLTPLAAVAVSLVMPTPFPRALLVR